MLEEEKEERNEMVLRLIECVRFIFIINVIQKFFLVIERVLIFQLKKLKKSQTLTFFSGGS